MPKKIHGRNLQAAINKSRTETQENPGADLLLFSCSFNHADADISLS